MYYMLVVLTNLVSGYFGYSVWCDHNCSILGGFVRKYDLWSPAFKSLLEQGGGTPIYLVLQSLSLVKVLIC